MAEYKGTVELIGGLTPKNNGTFPLVIAKDIQVDDTGKRLDEKLSDLEQGGGTVTVTVDGAAGTASHSSTEIYALVQAGNTVVAVLPDYANYTYQYDKYNEPTAANAMRATVEFIHTAVDENGIVTTDYIIIHDDKSADTGYYEGTGGADGITPHIGENGNWFIGDEDTGVKAKGEDGDPYTLTEDDKALIVAQVIESLGGNPIFGYVDEDNNIIVQGNLADGTYTVKYEMEDGSTVDIGDLMLDSNTYYSVTKNLTNCALDNSATQVVAGGSYSATVTANSGYTLDTVSVTMGGSAVSVSGGVINIASVTGDIVITAVASEAVVEPSYTNLCVENGDGWITDGRCGSDGTDRTGSAGNIVTNYIPVKVGDVVSVQDLEVARGGSLYSGIYKADKTAIKGFYMTTDYSDCVTNIDRVDGAYACSFTIANAEAGYIRLCGQRKSDDTEIIITVNQEIK